MFDIGFWEMTLLLVLALVILGPDRASVAVRMIGLWLGRARATFYSVRSELDREFQVQEMRKAGREFETELNRSLEQAAVAKEAGKEQLTPPEASTGTQPSAPKGDGKEPGA